MLQCFCKDSPIGSSQLAKDAGDLSPIQIPFFFGFRLLAGNQTEIVGHLQPSLKLTNQILFCLSASRSVASNDVDERYSLKKTKLFFFMSGQF